MGCAGSYSTWPLLADANRSGSSPATRTTTRVHYPLRCSPIGFGIRAQKSKSLYRNQPKQNHSRVNIPRERLSVRDSVMEPTQREFEPNRKAPVQETRQNLESQKPASLKQQPSIEPDHSYGMEYQRTKMLWTFFAKRFMPSRRDTNMSSVENNKNDGDRQHKPHEAHQLNNCACCRVLVWADRSAARRTRESAAKRIPAIVPCARVRMNCLKRNTSGQSWPHILYRERKAHLFPLS